MSYYNTNQEEGFELLQSKKKAQTQEEVILTLFNKKVFLSPSPDDVRDVCNTYPITSVRRALTNLTDKGLLVKTDRFKMGKLGKKTHTWSLPSIGENTNDN
tara:strand:+ start:173 stop:475 length:303 start_codon:yes stop_codon:yes gene_type:complete